MFRLVTDLKPCGDQPNAIAALADGVKKGMRNQTLLGVTGSGKTYTIAQVIAAVQKPTLVMAPNKTLAAQLYGELKDFFPEEAKGEDCYNGSTANPTCGYGNNVDTTCYGGSSAAGGCGDGYYYGSAACSDGSYASGDCGYGAVASSTCSAYGNQAVSQCGYGNHADSNCNEGVSAGISCNTTGSIALACTNGGNAPSGGCTSGSYS